MTDRFQESEFHWPLSGEESKEMSVASVLVAAGQSYSRNVSNAANAVMLDQRAK
jgi:hypothetical protein